MKKILFAIASVALLFATSCKKENVNPAVDVPEGSFLATIDNGANPQNAPRISDGMGTMTTIDANRYVIWENNDQITINGISYETNTTGSTVVFAPADPEQQAAGPDYHAFFGVANPSTTAAAAELPATQTIVLDGNNKITVRNLPMYAHSTNNQLTFHNICAALKITIPSYLNGATSIEVSCSDKAMNGAFGITNNAAVMSNETPSDAEKKITIQKSSGNFATNEVVYIAVPAQKCSDFKIEFFNNSGSMWTKTIKSFTFEVNKVYNINVTPKELCFTAQTAGATVTFNIKNVTETIQYSTDAMSWSTYTSGNSITLTNVGDFVCFRASASHSKPFGHTNGLSSSSQFVFTGTVKASGNIMSLYGPGSPNTIPVSSAFEYLFANCSGLQTAPELPATTLKDRCYFAMFKGCSSLTAAPVLPATTLTVRCYYSMFDGCTCLAAAPSLPAETLAVSCYFKMFYGCTALTVAPSLPATTLQNYCYQQMFEGCSKLTEVTMKATSVSATSCLTDWLKSAGTSVTKDPGNTHLVHVASGMSTNSDITTSLSSSGNKSQRWDATEQ